MLFRTQSNTPFRMFRLLTVQGGSVHVDMRFNFEKCYNFYRAGVQLALAICVYFSFSCEKPISTFSNNRKAATGWFLPAAANLLFGGLIM